MKQTGFMKIIACIVFILLSAFAAKAQQPIKPYSLSDSLGNGVLRLTKPKLTYKNNYNHFDIYTSTPDNMYVIKPDSTISFNMPTGNYRLISMPVEKPKEK